MKKRLKVFIILLFLIIIYLYTANICLMPKSITLLQGEKLELASLWGINLKQKRTTNYTNFNTDIEIEKNIQNGTLETASVLNNKKIDQVRKNRNGC